MNLRKEKDGGIVLCCNKAKCPVVRKTDDNTLTITDDDGNVVTLDIDQAKLLNEAIDQLDDK